MTHQELGEQLKIARERLGLEVKEAAGSIRIDAKFIDKMEQGDFTFLAEVYVKSFLKEYAVVLHLDPDEVMEAYMGLRKEPEVKHQKPAPPPQVVAPPPPVVPKKDPLFNDQFDEHNTNSDRSAEPKVDYQQKLRDWLVGFMANHDKNYFKRLLANKKSYIAIGGVILLLAVILYAIFSGKSGSKEIITDNRQVDELLNGVKDTTKNKFDGVSLPETKLPPNADTVILVINTKDSTKIRAIIDKHDTLKYALEPAVPRTLNASKRIELRVDNPALLSVILNDKPLELPKKKGVQTFNIEKTGIVTKAATKNDKRPKKKDTKSK
ncbi:hypothetical protein MASR1M107_18770 [Ignavibacteriales bacterium]